MASELRSEVDRLKRLVRDQPQDVASLVRLGEIHQSLGDPSAARAAYLQALDVTPDHPQALRKLAHNIRHTRFKRVSSRLHSAIRRCLNLPNFNKKLLAIPAVSCLTSDPQFASALDAFESLDYGQLNGRYRSGSLNGILSNPLLLSLLAETIVPDERIEHMLRILRRMALMQANEIDGNERSVGDVEFEFHCALASQSFNNEYVYSCPADEQELLENLKGWLDSEFAPERLATGTFPWRLVVACMYEPLIRMATLFERLSPQEDVWPVPVRQIIRRQVVEVRQELKYRQSVVCIHPIDNSISQSVQAQYEESPYPRWMSASQQPRSPASAVVSSLVPHFQPDEFPFDGQLDCLVAGCGTGKNAVQMATMYDDCHVLAIDLSAASLAYARRMTEELGLGNVEFMQGDILDLKCLGRHFHIIESIGVLHHLEQPLEGWQILTDVLLPRGLMKIGLYSELARGAVRAFQQWRLARGLGDSLQDIRRGRDEVMRLPVNDPIRVLAQQPNFFSLSECRDLLFHVQEHRFTVPQVARAIEQQGLRFLGFEAPATLRRAYSQFNPADTHRIDLTAWDAFEQLHPIAFAGMYLIWCQKR